MNLLARDLMHRHLMQPVSIQLREKTYAGILRHFTQNLSNVQTFITSSDNAVIVGSLTLPLDHPITFTGRGDE